VAVGSVADIGGHGATSRRNTRRRACGAGSLQTTTQAPTRNPLQALSRLRPALVALPILAALALPACALAAAFKLTPQIPNHRPTVGREWPIKLVVTRGRTKLSGSISYEYLFNGSVLSKQKGHRFTDGVYTDRLVFPSKSVGQPLTLRFLVVVPRYGMQKLDWAITPRR
jgi:hypothetical protein